MVRKPAVMVRASRWWTERSTRARLRILVAGVGLLGLVLRDLLLVVSAAITLLLAETITTRAAKPRPS